jgi:hypothetical protein
VHRIFPLIGIARFNVKFAVLPAFLLPLLAARGIDLCAQAGGAARRRLALVAGAVLAGMAVIVWSAGKYPLAWDDSRATAENAIWRGALLMILAVGIFALAKIKNGAARLVLQIALLLVPPLDALTHSPNLAPTLDATILAPGFWTAAGRPAPPKLGEGRIMISPAAERQMQYSMVTNLADDFAGKRLAEWYNLNLLDGIPKVSGAFTLRPAAFDVLERYLYYTDGARYGQHLLDFLSVAWFSAPDNPTAWLARTNFMPVITAGQMPEFASEKETLRAMVATDFEPRATVYLPETARGRVAVSNRTECVVSGARFADNEITANVFAKAPSLVVLSQADYHLWRATVDGQPAEILRANLAFQAVQVPAGTHRVKLVYRDPNLMIGGIISLLSLAVCGGIWRRKNP